MSAGYHVIFSKDAGCYTVGSGYGDEWAPESDHEFRDDADRRAFFLNHGREMDAPLVPAVAVTATVEPWDLFAAAFAAGYFADGASAYYSATIAGDAGKFADAMMAERAKRKGVQS